MEANDLNKRVEDMSLEDLYEQTGKLESLIEQMRHRRIAINEEIVRKEGIRHKSITVDAQAEPMVIDEETGQVSYGTGPTGAPAQTVEAGMGALDTGAVQP